MINLIVKGEVKYKLSSESDSCDNVPSEQSEMLEVKTSQKPRMSLKKKVKV